MCRWSPWTTFTVLRKMGGRASWMTSFFIPQTVTRTSMMIWNISVSQLPIFCLDGTVWAPYFLFLSYAQLELSYQCNSSLLSEFAKFRSNCLYIVLAWKRLDSHSTKLRFIHHTTTTVYHWNTTPYLSHCTMTCCIVVIVTPFHTLLHVSVHKWVTKSAGLVCNAGQ